MRSTLYAVGASVFRALQPRTDKAKSSAYYLYLVWAWGFGVSGILMGPLFIAGSILEVVSGVQTKSWPSVTGTIVSSEVVQQIAGNKVSYSPGIRYLYQVGDKSYAGTHIWAAEDNQGETETRKLAAQFPLGSSAAVFYKPTSPNNAVLITGTNAYMFLFVGVSVVVFVTALAVCPIWTFLRGRITPT